MPTPEALQGFLEKQPNPERHIERLPLLTDAGDNVPIIDFRYDLRFMETLTKAGLTQGQRAGVARVLGQAGIVMVGREAYRLTVGDIRTLSDSNLRGISGVGERGVKILRALFGSKEG